MLSLGLMQARSSLIRYLEWILGTRIPNPRFITAAKLPEWSEQFWVPPGWKLVRIKRVLAAMTNEGVLIGDFSLEDLHQNLIANWLIPHELLHLVNLPDRDIENLLAEANRRFGRNDVAEFIRSHSGYLGN